MLVTFSDLAHQSEEETSPADQGQRQHPQVFRRAGLHLLTQGRDRGWIPDAVQGAPDQVDDRRLYLHPR